LLINSVAKKNTSKTNLPGNWNEGQESALEGEANSFLGCQSKTISSVVLSLMKLHVSANYMPSSVIKNIQHV